MNWKILGITSTNEECVIGEAYADEPAARKHAEAYMRKQDRLPHPTELRLYIQRPDGTRYRVVLVGGSSRRAQ